MANKKINQLNSLTIADNTDLLVIDDVSATETKKITVGDLGNSFSKPMSWYAQTSGSQSGGISYTKLLDLPFYVTSSNSNIVFQSVWTPSSPTTQMFGYYITIDNQTITASYAGTTINNAAMTLFGLAVANGASEGTIFHMTSSLSVGWHTASLYGKGQLDSWSTGTANSNAVWGAYYQGARLLVTEEPK